MAGGASVVYFLIDMPGLHCGKPLNRSQRLAILLACCLSWSASRCTAAQAVRLEVALERGADITAAQEWTDVLAGAGFQQIRLRSRRPGELPRLKVGGNDDRPTYQVLGLLTARGDLLLPGSQRRYGKRDRQALRDYLDKLRSEGAAGLHRQVVSLGLSQTELDDLRKGLAEPVAEQTLGEPTAAVVARMIAQLPCAVQVAPAAGQRLQAGGTVRNEWQEIAAGTALAGLLRAHGLALRPVRQAGKPTSLEIVELGPMTDVWPVGQSTDASPRQLAPELFQLRNVEIAGFEVREVLSAVDAKLPIRLLVDHRAVARHQVDLTKSVSLPASRTYLKRVLDRSIGPLGMVSELRVDDGGQPLLWITTVRE